MDVSVVQPAPFPARTRAQLDGGSTPTRGLHRTATATRAEDSGTPIVLRLAGLSVEALRPFLCAECGSPLAAREALASELQAWRQQLAEAIERTLPTFDGPTRRQLLAVRRNCHNGRPLSGLQGPCWDT